MDTLLPTGSSLLVFSAGVTGLSVSTCWFDDGGPSIVSGLASLLMGGPFIRV